MEKEIKKEVWEALSPLLEDMDYMIITYTRLAEKLYPSALIYNVEGKKYILVEK